MKTSLYFVCLIMLSGCVIHHVNTYDRAMPDEAMPKLNIKQSVAVRNISTGKGEFILCSVGSEKWVGNLYEHTDTAVSIVKDAFERHSVKSNNNLDKSLDLSIESAKCEISTVSRRATAMLRVRTGNGLEKEYVGVDEYHEVFLITLGLEQAIINCVEQMFKDDDIKNYLEN